MRIRLIVLMLASAPSVALGGNQLVAASQQQPAAPSGDQTKQQAELTLTGCLMRSDTSARAPATTGSTSPGAAPPEAKKSVSGFILKDAVAKNAATAAPNRGTAGTTGAGAGQPAERPVPDPQRSSVEFRLSPGDNVDLKRYLYRVVEVRGRPVSAVAGTGDPQLTPGRADTANALIVTSIREVASSCPTR